VQYCVILALLIIQLCITFLLEVPGCGRGYIGPGGLAEGGQYMDCTGGAAGYIDKQVLGLNHIYQYPTCRDIYQTGAYDPEGILGCLTSIVITYLGVVTGRVLVYYPQTPERLKRWFVWGLVLGCIALGLCGGRQNGGAIPLNKNMWSLSFILAQAGMGCWALGVCYVLIDVLNIWNGAPFVYPGMNSIAVYVTSEIGQPNWPLSWQAPSDGADTHGFQMTTNVVSVALLQLMAWYMYHHDVMVKI